MKNKLLLAICSLALCIGASSCDDLLDRPQKNTPDDNAFWKTESDVRLYSHGFYGNYFIGYGQGWSASYSPFRGYGFSDDVASTGTQSNFSSTVPTSVMSTSETAVGTYDTQFSCPSMVFSWIRKANIMIDRINTRMDGVLTTEAKNHWLAVAKFFKCFSYCRLVQHYGDVPYFEKELGTTDLDELYKDRDSRVYVMDKVMEMSKEVLANMRTNDGTNILNSYVAAAFISRWFLFEGTFQKYHNGQLQGGDLEAAKRYLDFARQAAEVVINSGAYDIDQPLSVIFGSQDLTGKSKEPLMVHQFLDSEAVRHCVASYSNSTESQSGLNLAFLKSVIRQDGKPYTTSSLCSGDPSDLSLEKMGATCDPRFEASIADVPVKSSSTLVYQHKFIDRKAWELSDKDRGQEPIYQSVTNTNDAPVIRYAEVLLNWIEAKAELGNVTQDDIDKSINKLRARPLDATAIAKGLKNTEPMKLADINDSFDPERDAGVQPEIRDIRRERRLEMVFQHSRILDLRRWHKLDNMDNKKHPDTMCGPWVDFANGVVKGAGAAGAADANAALSTLLKAESTTVMKADGTLVVYDGTNAADMVGFYRPTNIKPRNDFYERNYVAPVGSQDISKYLDKGYKLTQTKGWENI